MGQVNSTLALVAVLTARNANSNRIDEGLAHTPISWWRVSKTGWGRWGGTPHQSGLSWFRMYAVTVFRLDTRSDIATVGCIEMSRWT